MEAVQKWRWICSPSPRHDKTKGIQSKSKEKLFTNRFRTTRVLGERWHSKIMVEVSELEFPPLTEPLRQFSISEPEFVWWKSGDDALYERGSLRERREMPVSLPCSHVCSWMSGALPDAPAPTWHVPRQCVQVPIFQSQSVLRGLVRKVMAKLKRAHEFQLLLSSTSWGWHLTGQLQPSARQRAVWLPCATDFCTASFYAIPH